MNCLEGGKHFSFLLDGVDGGEWTVPGTELAKKCFHIVIKERPKAKLFLYKAL